jgi:hypothetical protein
MNDTRFSSTGDQPESLTEAVEGRFASLVHIMNGPHSPLSHLGVLELGAGSLSLHDVAGQSLFSVPVESVEARRQRRVAVNQIFFRVRAGERWWYLAPHAPNKYERRSTRDFVEHSNARELAPRPNGMSEATYLRLTKNPTRHQEVWVRCWLEALNRAGAASPDV